MQLQQRVAELIKKHHKKHHCDPTRIYFSPDDEDELLLCRDAAWCRGTGGSATEPHCASGLPQYIDGMLAVYGKSDTTYVE